MCMNKVWSIYYNNCSFRTCKNNIKRLSVGVNRNLCRKRFGGRELRCPINLSHVCITIYHNSIAMSQVKQLSVTCQLKQVLPWSLDYTLSPTNLKELSANSQIKQIVATRKLKILSPTSQLKQLFATIKLKQISATNTVNKLFVTSLSATVKQFNQQHLADDIGLFNTSLSWTALSGIWLMLSRS